ncbi:MULTISPECIES: Rieske 2Fe-2S domain-containing protein [unclassified Streptomyces]|uniref:Rieske 2Fe-2S domain-containing protein n=1 Tax=unclassified Streptomyces TaxID=2593676 RepID=UPI00048ECD48|nr:Rieske 2Fe-2S domain-containing protein [Streptomyces sp. DpondAA-D4]MYY14563.1 Rieske 2Fe-2S domain-containing protein [Streptomyces sp. SID4912]
MGLSRGYGRASITEGPTPADAAGMPALPYPDGWFALAFSEELRRGTVLTRPLAGQDVVLYRLGTRAVRAVRPYCPHLGAHLGLARVEGEDLICPFHLFAFGPDGACVRTGYDTPPPRSPLTQLPVHEVNGVVFVWRHHDGRAPDWFLPDWHEIGHRPARSAAWEMAGNVQEVIENTVDLGHFATLHGWTKAEIGGPVIYDDATFHASMRAHESAPLLGDFVAHVEVDGYGLGCLHVDVHTPRMGLRMCTTVLPTPVGPNRMQFRQRNRIAFDEPARLPPPLARAVSRTAARLLEGAVFRSSCEFTAADFPIWHHKEYRHPPRLAAGDGPIGPFRRWARRFYPPVPVERGGGQVVRQGGDERVSGPGVPSDTGPPPLYRSPGR